MAGIVALDLSKSSAGWACLPEGAAKPIFGHWVLGSEYTSDGRTFVKLHEMLHDLWRLTKFDHLFYEEAINPASLSGHTNIDTLRVLGGLCAHAQSFGEAVGCRTIKAVNLTSWRRHFIGKMPRGTKSKELKEYAMERCQQLGFKPARHDEAEAIGILDYACDLRGFVPPWRANEVLRPALGAAK